MDPARSKILSIQLIYLPMHQSDSFFYFNQEVEDCDFKIIPGNGLNTLTQQVIFN